MKKSEQKKLFAALIIVLVSLIVLTSATYAWMEISSSPTVTNLALSVITDSTLVLAPNKEDGTPGDWSTLLNLADYSKLAAPLRPVTYVAADSAFYSPKYGIDGRISSCDTRLTDENGNLYDWVIEAQSDPEGEGYLYTVTFWAATGTADCSVGLSTGAIREGEELGSGTFVIGEPKWTSSEDKDGNITYYHEADTTNPQYSIRVGFLAHAIDEEELVRDGDEQQPLSDSMRENLTNDIFVIYEPNADGPEEKGIRETLSIIQPEDKNADPVPLQGNNRLIRQKSTTFEDLSVPLRDTVVYTIGDFITAEPETDEYGRTLQDDSLELFKLMMGVPRKITMYLWLEGQDADCANAIALIKDYSADIIANIQFEARDLSDHTLVSTRTAS